MFGDSHVHQNPGLMAIALVWFRYHNYMAQRIQADHPNWTDDEVFERSRRRVIAALQVGHLIQSLHERLYNAFHLSIVQ